jgi:serine/threonine protein kinase
MKGIMDAINYCHRNYICHRDIKPENILINDKDEIKIIDFGLSKVVRTKGDSLSGFAGTKRYMAPEVLNREPYDEKCDIWCIGHIFFFLLTFSNHPFNDDEERMRGLYKSDLVETRSE